MLSQRFRRSGFTIGLLVLLSLLAFAPGASAQAPNPPAGAVYTVRLGDSWSSVAVRTGVSVAQLMSANPHAMHPRGWLWVGDRLFVPKAPAAVAAPQARRPVCAGYWYRVRSGDTWRKLAARTGLSLSTLQRANPGHVRANLWLYTGEWLWIPANCPAPAPAPGPRPGSQGPVPGGEPGRPGGTEPRDFWPYPTAAPRVSPEAAATPVPTAPSVAKPVIVPAATITPTAEIAAPATVTRTAGLPTRAATPTPGAADAARPAAATPAAAKGCPAAFAGYPDAVAAYLSGAASSLSGLSDWLTGCGAITEKTGGVTQAAIQGSDSNDVLVVLRDPASDQVSPRSELLIYHAGLKAYTLARKVEGAGLLALLRAGDVNADGKPDVVWSDTSCGAHTCFSTLSVESWDGKAYRKWIEGEPTMAAPDYSFISAAPDGAGQAIVAHGGVIGAAGAGPQRAWTETYVSTGGNPYRLLGQVYDESTCLYHHILDANQAFKGWTADGFAPAVTAYRAALDDPKLAACGDIPDELTRLRDFARFRLVVANVVLGRLDAATKDKTEITDPALLGAATAFVDSYKASSSVIQACRDTTAYAVANPDSWVFLADWGYANPNFTPQDLCPLD